MLSGFVLCLQVRGGKPALDPELNWCLSLLSLSYYYWHLDLQRQEVLGPADAGQETSITLAGGPTPDEAVGLRRDLIRWNNRLNSHAERSGVSLSQRSSSPSWRPTSPVVQEQWRKPDPWAESVPHHWGDNQARAPVPFLHHSPTPHPHASLWSEFAQLSS